MHLNGLQRQAPPARRGRRLARSWIGSILFTSWFVLIVTALVFVAEAQGANDWLRIALLAEIALTVSVGLMIVILFRTRLRHVSFRVLDWLEDKTEDMTWLVRFRLSHLMVAVAILALLLACLPWQGVLGLLAVVGLFLFGCLL